MAKNLKLVQNAIKPFTRNGEGDGGANLQTAQRQPETGPPASNRVRRSTLVLAFLTVILPTILGIIYYGWFATDRYVSQAQVTVRSSGDVSGASLDSMLGGIVSSSSGNREAYVVQEYMQSSEIVEQLQKWLSLKETWSAERIDLISRLSSDATMNDLHDYYQGMVSATYAPEKNVVTLKVQGYTPDDAKALATSIITLSESLVNRISEQIRTDAVEFAKQEVKEAEDRVRDARLDIKKFQNKHGDLDPERSAEAIGGIIADLESQLAQVRTKIASQSTYLRSDSAAMESLYAQEDALEKQISRERDRLTGQTSGGGEAYAGLLVDYERLKLQMEFARQAYDKAQIALEQARIEAARKQLYLVDFVEPSLPDEPTRPEGYRNVLIIFVGGLIVFAILSLIAAAIREHARI